MGNTINIQDLIYIVMKRIKLLIIVPLLCAGAGLLITIYAVDNVYEAHVDLLVNQTSAEDTDLPASTDVEMNLRLIETYQYIIGSSKIRELVGDELDHQYSLEHLKQQLTVASSPDSQIITLSARAGDAKSASKIVNAFAEISQEEITDLMQMENIRILSKAKAANFSKPVSPKPVLFTIISFLIGVLFVLIYIALSAFFNTKIHSRHDVERYLNVPLLGTVGMFAGFKKKNICSSDMIQQVSRANQNKMNIEAFRTLRVNIQFQRSTKKVTSIMVTSTEKNEGKTITAGNLAMSMAMDHKKTVLIDADLRKMSLVEHNDADEMKGLSNYLSGQAKTEELIRETSYENLYMIQGGPLPPNPTELIASLRMDRLLAELEKQFDMIIIDSSPLFFPDAAVLAAKVDGCVFVSHSGKTKVTHAQQAMHQLKTVNATVLGAVLNSKKEKKKVVSY